MAGGVEVIRRLLEQLGIVQPSEPIHVARDQALAINREARDEIHASREKRTILSLDYELARRKPRRAHR